MWNTDEKATNDFAVNAVSEELKTEMAICVYESLLKDIKEQEQKQAEKPDKPTLVWPVQSERFKK